MIWLNVKEVGVEGLRQTRESEPIIFDCWETGKIITQDIMHTQATPVTILDTAGHQQNGRMLQVLFV